MDLHTAPRQALSAALVRAQAGRSIALLVHGEGGVGKTHLLASVLAEARAAGWQCLQAAAHEYDRDIAYSTLRNLLAALDAGTVPADLRAAALNILAALDATVLGPADADEHPGQQAAPVLTTRLLRAMALAAPTVIVVDDVHLADADSLVALALAARHLSGHRLVFIFASRTLPWQRDADLPATIGHLVSDEAGSVLELLPVSGRQLDDFVADRLNAVPDARLSQYLAEQTRGNTLLLRATLDALLDAGAIRIGDGSAYLLDDSPPRYSRREALLRNIFTGQQLDRQLAKVVAVFGRVDLEHLPLLSDLARQPVADIQAAFDALVQAGALIVTDSGWYEFSHPLIAELLYDDVGPAERRRLHAAIARHCDGSGGLRISATEYARHVAEGASRGDKRAIDLAMQTADLALRTSPLAAALWYGRVLKLLPEQHPAAGAALGKQAVAWWKGARPAAAVAAGRQALQLLPAGRARERTVGAMVNCYNAMGNLTAAAELLTQEASLATQPVTSLAQRAAITARLGDTPHALMHAQLGWAGVAAATPADKVSAYTYLGQFEGTAGTFHKLTDAVAKLSGLGRDQAGLPEGARISALESAAHSAAIAGDTATAGLLLGYSAEVSGSLGFGDLGGQAAVAGALVDFATGKWNQALELIARESLQLEFAGLSRNLARLRSVEAQIHAARGDVPRAQEILAANEPDQACRVDHALWQASVAWLKLGTAKAADAMTTLVLVHGAATAQGWNEVATTTYTALVEGYLAGGQHQDAQRVAKDFTAHATATGMPRDFVAAGLAAAMAGSIAGPASEVLRYAQEHRMDCVAAQAHYTLGHIGERPTENLMQSWLAFDALGAKTWRRKVEAAARSQGVGLAKKSREGPGPAALTAVDSQLLRMLGEGRTNRQIADALGYSPKTIEAYLTRLYRKTGYASRIELIVAHERGDLAPA